MRSKRSPLLLLPAALLLSACNVAPSSPVASPETEQGRDNTSTAATLAATCSGCHGTGSNGKAIVSLDGYSSDQIYAGLQHYRQDPNGVTAMHRMARGYTEEQVQLIASYLGQP